MEAKRSGEILALGDAIPLLHTPDQVGPGSESALAVNIPFIASPPAVKA